MHKKHPRPVVPVHKHLGPKQQQGQQQQGEQRKQPNKQQQQQQGKRQQGSNAGSGPAHKKQKSNHANQHAVANGYMTPQRQQQPQQQQHKAQVQQQHKQDKTDKQQQVQPKQQWRILNKAVQAQKQPPQQAQAVALLPQQQQQQQQPHKRSKKRKRGDAGPVPPAAAGATSPPAASAAGEGPAPKAAAAAAAAAAKPWQPGAAAAISSNWQALQQQLKAAKAAAAAAGQHKPFRRKRKYTDDGQDDSSKVAKRQIGSLGRNTALTHIVAMDCEMVGVGSNGDRDSLARVSIVNAAGNVLLDTFVAQKEAVTDFRTWVSGVTPQHLIGAPSIEEVQKQVCELLSGRVVVGHSLNKDLKVLLLSHPRKDIRDTAKYPPFMFSKGGKRRPKALKQLAQQELGLTIQEGQHSSVDDARAALYLYQKHAADWERVLKTPGGLKRLPASNQVARKKRVESYGAKAITDDPMADL